MKKILIVITTGFYSFGGLTTVVMNYYREMDKEDIIIDFASTNNPDEKLMVEIKNQSNYYNLGNRKRNIIKYCKNLYKLIKANKYDVIHVNGNSSTMALELKIAKVLNVKNRIAHVHNTRSKYPLLNKILNILLKKTYTKAIAVSKQAGDYLYGRNYIVLNNAIDTSNFIFNKELRSRIREKFGFKNEFVIGNVGKLEYQKNQEFLIDIFSEYKKVDNNSKLIIAGGGSLEKKLKLKAEKMGLEKDIIFLGMITNVNEVMQAFDCFVFTSIYEGLGMVLIEAQASGLKCLSSDTVPKETFVTDNIKYLSIEDSTNKWISEIKNIKSQNNNRMILSKNAKESIKKNNYDIKSQAEKLLDIYLA